MITLFILAYLYLDNTVLLIRRSSQDFGRGLYSLLGGKVEQGESALRAIRREVLEEVGLDIPESAFKLVHTLHRKGTETEFIALCFKADISVLPAPYNNEPDKHNDVRLFDVTQLPVNIIPAHKQIIECIQQNIAYSEHGWSNLP